ncbi:hypothetical protein B0H19DRAFT_1249373 [Mycena capillaripes]|nr:hypothetical protein B0H19DRAFT_1249373 [Mycena capillaripes]
MPSLCRALLISALFIVSAHAFCGDNGGAELGWGTQADADANGANPRTVLGFNPAGPLDAAGSPILSVIATNAGFDASFYAFAAFLCGQANPDSYPQTTFGPVISATSTNSDVRCLTVSAIGEANATVSLQPCVNDISTPPVPTQTFEWIGTAFITYGFAFLGNASGLPLAPNVSTDYTPSLVPDASTVGAYLRLDYTPGALPPSTGLETGLILELSDD